MRRLIFSWFLGSLALLVGIIVAALLWSVPVFYRGMGRHFASGLLGDSARQAASSYELEGVEGLRKFARDSHPSARSRTALLDEMGRDLMENADWYRQWDLLNRFKRPGDVKTEIHGGIAQFGAVTRGPGGKVYTLVVEIPAGELFLSTIPWTEWLVRVGLILVTAAVVCSWLATKLLRPIEDLRRQTRSFAEGDLRVRSTGGLARGLPEIEALAQDFDYMAERIETLVGSQRQLLHYVSHELRTPLTRLQLAIGIAQKEPTPEILGRIDREGQRLNELLSQIMNYSKLEAAEFLPRQPVDCRDFVASLVGDASFEALATGKQVVVRGSQGVRYLGDRELLRSALENVILNAIRHAPPGGTVEVEQRELAGGGWEVLIDDRGPRG